MGASLNNNAVLIIGDIEKILLDYGACNGLGYRICRNCAEALDAAGRGNFTTIAVAISALSGSRDSALKALRQCNKHAKIVLLAQIHEEPLAMQLTSVATGGEPLADDYIIYPLTAERLDGLLSAEAGSSKAVQTPGDAGLERKIRLLEKMATEDDLTGLKNRRYVWEFLRQIIDYARKENGRVTLLLFDVDDLKSYNDTYGHLAGDQILKQAAVLVRRCCRKHDVVGRIGGDEFAVVFWDGPTGKDTSAATDRRTSRSEHPKEVISIAKRFQRELEKAESPLLGPKGKGRLTISGGLASFPRDGTSADELFEQVDKALLEAKRSGKNKIYLAGKPDSDIAEIK